MSQTTERAAFTIVEAGPAWEYYKNFRQWLRSDHVGQLVEARGEKPLTLDEVRSLVGYDLDKDGQPVKETCSGCQKEFNTVSWVNIADPRFIEYIADGRPIEEAIQRAEPLIFGSYYMNPDMQNGYGAFCGRPYIFIEDARKYVLRNNACIVAAKMAHPDKFWGICRHAVDFHLYELAEAKRQQEEREKRAAEARKKYEQDMAAKQLAAAKFFGNKPGRGCNKHNGK